jgi:hypothetical protein
MTCLPQIAPKRGFSGLFARLSLSSPIRPPSTRSFTSAIPSASSAAGTAPPSLPALPTGHVLSNARTKAARDARAQTAAIWFLQGWLPSEIAIALR